MSGSTGGWYRSLSPLVEVHVRVHISILVVIDNIPRTCSTSCLLRFGLQVPSEKVLGVDLEGSLIPSEETLGALGKQTRNIKVRPPWLP